MSNFAPSKLMDLLEKTGLDWLLVLFNEQRFLPEVVSPSRERIQQINAQVQEFDEHVIDDVIAHFEKLNDDTDKRWNYVEAKATTLLGFASIGTTFVLGISQFSFGTSDKELIMPLRIIIVGTYILIATSLFITITLSRKVMAVSASSIPKASDMLALRNWNRLKIQQQYAGSLFIAYEYNSEKINRKVSYLLGAEKWFNNTVLLLLGLLVLVGTALVIPSTQISGESQNVPAVETDVAPTVLLTLTQTTPISATLTFPSLNPITGTFQMQLSPLLTITKVAPMTPTITVSTTYGITP